MDYTNDVAGYVPVLELADALQGRLLEYVGGCKERVVSACISYKADSRSSLRNDV